MTRNVFSQAPCLRSRSWRGKREPEPRYRRGVARGSCREKSPARALPCLVPLPVVNGWRCLPCGGFRLAGHPARRVRGKSFGLGAHPMRNYRWLLQTVERGRPSVARAAPRLFSSLLRYKNGPRLLSRPVSRALDQCLSIALSHYFVSCFARYSLRSLAIVKRMSRQPGKASSATLKTSASDMSAFTSGR